jgi:RNA polymerase sigma-70 factor (ECF subfamily)
MLPRVRNLVRYLVPGDSEVDDFAQESMIALMKGLRSYRGDGAFVAWTDRVVSRSVFKQLRKRKRSRQRVVAVGATPGDDPMERGPQPDEALAHREAVALLDELSLEQRHALVLRDVLEMTSPEIAEQLGVPVETVRSRLKVAKAKFIALAEKRGQR